MRDEQSQFVDHCVCNLRIRDKPYSLMTFDVENISGVSKRTDNHLFIQIIRKFNALFFF